MKKTNQNFNRSARSFKQLIKELRAALADEYKFEKSIPLKIIDAIEQSKDLDVQAGVGIARQSLLDFAADQRCPKVAALLLENGADPNARGLFEYTPIMTATFRNCFDIVKLLVDNGAIVNVTFTDRFPVKVRIPLAEAYERFFTYNDYDPRIVKLLANEISRDPEKDMAQWEKQFLEDKGIGVKKWLDLGVNIDCRGQEGRTPLLTAIFKENANIVRTLVENGASLKAVDDKGRTVKDYLRFIRNKEIETIVKSGMKSPVIKRETKGIDPK